MPMIIAWAVEGHQGPGPGPGLGLGGTRGKDGIWNCVFCGVQGISELASKAILLSSLREQLANGRLQCRVVMMDDDDDRWRV